MTAASDPTSGCGRRRMRLVDRAFTGDLPPWRTRRLRAHLAGCAPCRARYDRLAAIDRQLAGRRTPLGPLAIDALAASVAGAAEAEGPRTRRMVWSAAGVVAAAAGLALIVRAGGRGDDARLVGRGSGGAAPDRQVGVRAFCVAVYDGRAVVIADSRAGLPGQAPALRCNLDAELQLAYSTPELEGLTMVAFGLQERAVHYYAPRSPEAPAVPLASGRIDEPLAWSTRLGVKHRPGTYDVVVRVFDHPVAAAAAVAGGARPRSELRFTLVVDAEEGSAP